MTRVILFCLIAFLCFTCSKTRIGHTLPNSEEDIVFENENGNGTTDPTIHIQFQSYYDNFIEEMLLRGEDLSDIPISIEFVNPNFQPGDVSYCGLGYFNYIETGVSKVEIVNSGYCWTGLSDIEKENLIFHEFGHALLNRSHTAGLLPNGLATSLMCSSNGCNTFYIYNAYQEAQRSYYLDELLNENINIPSWAGTKTYSSTLDDDQISETAEGWIPETIFPANTNSNNPYSFSIDTNQFTSAPYALAITTTSNSESNTYGNWYKDYTIADFDDCSNLIAEVNFKSTNSLENGYLNLIIDLYDNIDSETEFKRHYAEIETATVGSGFYRLRTTAICIPDDTAKFRIRLYVKSESNATVYFDDLKVDMYD